MYNRSPYAQAALREIAAGDPAAAVRAAFRSALTAGSKKRGPGVDRRSRKI